MNADKHGLARILSVPMFIGVYLCVFVVDFNLWNLWLKIDT
ncbi:MAG: hypothetical protein QME16_05285 [Planctomycetota bacterium]|nr:hypothetical protein [Planctomycetota bacterium]